MSLNAALRRTKGQFLHRRHHPERCPLLLPRIIILFRKKLVSRDGLLDQWLVVLLHWFVSCFAVRCVSGRFLPEDQRRRYEHEPGHFQEFVRLAERGHGLQPLQLQLLDERRVQTEARPIRHQHGDIRTATLFRFRRWTRRSFHVVSDDDHTGLFRLCLLPEGQLDLPGSHSANGLPAVSAGGTYRSKRLIHFVSTGGRAFKWTVSLLL